MLHMARWAGVLVLVALGAGLFSTGFLTMRRELSDVNACGDGGPVPCAMQPTFDKLVLLIVDAVREDFFFSAAAPDAEALLPDNDLPKLRQLVAEAGPAALAARFVADIPTITISRIKAWLTGCLPTFLDIGQSFSAVTLSEDNILSQLAAHGKRTVFMGDDTWMQLAPPGVFAAAHPFPSFNVLDMHSVDDGVWQHLQRYLAQPASWDVLVAHYLGVDHAGHAHGVRSAAMAAKLAQMDQQVTAVARTLMRCAGPGGPHQRTLLLVLSDHGQTLGGDHGGSSPDEVNTLLVALDVGTAAAPVTGLEDVTATTLARATPGEANADAADADAASAPASAAGRAAPSKDHQAVVGDGLPPMAVGVTGAPPRAPPATVVHQLDLTATLAALLGVPPPYSNLGSVHPQLWQAMASGARAPARVGGDGANGQRGGRGSGADGTAAGLKYLQALMMTCRQVRRYLLRYGSLPSAPLQAALQRHARAESLAAQLMRPAQGTTPPSTAYQQGPEEAPLPPAPPVPGAQQSSQARERLEEDEQQGQAHCCEKPAAVMEYTAPYVREPAAEAEAHATLLWEATAESEAFLAAAATLARAQFTGCNLPRTAAGAVLLAAAAALLVAGVAADLAQLWRAQQPGGRSASAQRSGSSTTGDGVRSPLRAAPAVATAVQPPSVASTRHMARVGAWWALTDLGGGLGALPALLPLAVCAFQSFSLFGLDWMMAEGRVLAGCTAACLGGTAAAGVALVAAPPGAGGCRAWFAAPAGGPCHRRRHHRRHHLAARRAAACALGGALGALCVLLLAHWGLMDRGSADPHNKTARSTTLGDLLGAPAAADAASNQAPPARNATAARSTPLLLHVPLPSPIAAPPPLPGGASVAPHWWRRWLAALLIPPGSCDLAATLLPLLCMPGAAALLHQRVAAHVLRGLAGPGAGTAGADCPHGVDRPCKANRHTRSPGSARLGDGAGRDAGGGAPCLAGSGDEPTALVTGQGAAVQVRARWRVCGTGCASAAGGGASGGDVMSSQQGSGGAGAGGVRGHGGAGERRLNCTAGAPAGLAAAGVVGAQYACLALWWLLHLSTARRWLVVTPVRALRWARCAASALPLLVAEGAAGTPEAHARLGTQLLMRARALAARWWRARGDVAGRCEGLLPEAPTEALWWAASTLSATLLLPLLLLLGQVGPRCGQPRWWRGRSWRAGAAAAGGAVLLAWLLPALGRSRWLPSGPTFSGSLASPRWLVAALRALRWHAGDVPLRLLLPRLVYLLSAAAAMRLLLAAPALRLLRQWWLTGDASRSAAASSGDGGGPAGRRQGRPAPASGAGDAPRAALADGAEARRSAGGPATVELGGHASMRAWLSAVADGGSPAEVVAERCSAALWLVACTWPPVTLLLGRRGPPVMALAAVAAACAVTLAAQVSALTAAAWVWGEEAEEAAAPGVGSQQRHGEDLAALEGRDAGRASGPKDGSSAASWGQGGAMSVGAQQREEGQDEEGSVLVCLAAAAAAPACVGAGLTFHALSSLLFFASGHYCEFTGLQYASPFIGFDDMQWWISPLLMGLNSFGALLLGALPLAFVPAVALSSSTSACSRGAGARGAPGSGIPKALSALARVAIGSFAAARCLTTTVLAVCSLVLHDHILVWAIIAPRVVFELFFVFVAACAMLAMYAVQ